MAMVVACTLTSATDEPSRSSSDPPSRPPSPLPGRSPWDRPTKETPTLSYSVLDSASDSEMPGRTLKRMPVQSHRASTVPDVTLVQHRRARFDADDRMPGRTLPLDGCGMLGTVIQPIRKPAPNPVLTVTVAERPQHRPGASTISEAEFKDLRSENQQLRDQKVKYKEKYKDIKRQFREQRRARGVEPPREHKSSSTSKSGSGRFSLLKTLLPFLVASPVGRGDINAIGAGDPIPSIDVQSCYPVESYTPGIQSYGCPMYDPNGDEVRTAPVTEIELYN